MFVVDTKKATICKLPRESRSRWPIEASNRYERQRNIDDDDDDDDGDDDDAAAADDDVDDVFDDQQLPSKYPLLIEINLQKKHTFIARDAYWHIGP